MMKRDVVILFLSVIVGILLCQCAEIPQLPIEIPVGLGFDSIIKKEPAITTSLEDAITELPFLDDFDPQDFVLMTTLPRDSNNAFVLRSGLFELNAQSYCLHAGKYVPGGGDGYVYAPLKGPYAHIVRNILRNSVDHPAIPQRDIQVLIWAIIARTKITEMPRYMQQTAAQLLEPEEISELNGGALGLIPEEVLQKASAALPSQVRQVLEAEARLRWMMTKTQATYEELEQVAVPFGDPPPGEGSREIPGKRWAYHPGGYFIRYFPSGYSRTLIQLSVPESFRIERDMLGRITLLADMYGNCIETEYDDTLEPLTISEDPDIRGYAFRSIRFLRPEIIHSEAVFDRKAEWENVGWTLVGVPSGQGQVGTPPDRFSDVEKRYGWALNHKKQVGKLDSFFETKGTIDDIMDLGHYALAMSQALSGDRIEKAAWVADHLTLIKKAWQYAVCMREGGGATEEGTAVSRLPAKGGSAIGLPVQFLVSADPTMRLLAESSSEKGNESSPKTYDPADNVATPGNTSRQRIGKSARSADPEVAAAEEEVPCEQIKNLQLYQEFVEMRRDFYKQYGDSAEGPTELDAMVNESMEGAYDQAEREGRIRRGGKQEAGGHYDPCTGEKFARNLCQKVEGKSYIKEKPLCEWITEGIRIHEDTHEADARNYVDRRRYCGGDPRMGKERAKIAAKWEYNAYNAEWKFYTDLIESFKEKRPDCFK